MKAKFFLLGAASLLLASCSNELDVPVDQAVVGGGTTPLSINVLANPTTKALVEGNSITSGQIGVKLVDNTGTTYDSQTYNNIFYSTTDGNTWTVDPANKILLSATEGKAYAYYPYSANAELDFTAIPISSAANPNEQIDYLYGDEATGLKNSNPSANFTMSHAMSIINFTIAKGTYTGAGAITSVKMKGNTASNTGTMNAVAGSVTATNKGYEFESTASLTLGSSTGKFIVVPSGEQSKLDFKIVMDGQTYTASTTDVTLASGQVYKYTLTMNSTGLTVSTVTVTPWGEPQNIGTGSGDAELYKPIITWDEAKTKDGVYGMMSDGRAMVYEAAATTAESLNGVAFVVNGKAYQVAKTEIYSHWHGDEDNLFNIDGVIDYTRVDGTNNYGYLAGSSTPQLSTDYNTWRDGCLGDFNGEANTTAIIKGHSDGTLANSLGKTVKDFRDGSNNESYTDWFVPACGELAFMFLKKTELNILLKKVSGTTISTDWYWSSSEHDSSTAWIMDFLDYMVAIRNKVGNFRVRLVRAI